MLINSQAVGVHVTALLELHDCSIRVYRSFKQVFKTFLKINANYLSNAICTQCAVPYNIIHFATHTVL